MALTQKTISQHVDRVVRTDFYFDREIAPSRWVSPGKSYNLAVVFIKKGKSAKRRQASPELKFTRVIDPPFDRDPEMVLEYLIRRPDDIGYTPDIIQTWTRRFLPYGLPHYLLSQKVVIERSPPLAESLGHLLHGATAISIGALLGTGLSPDPTVAFYAVPGGVIVMGAAIGISKGLEKGLTKLIDTSLAYLFPKRSRVSKAGKTSIPKAKVPKKKAKVKKVKRA